MAKKAVPVRESVDGKKAHTRTIEVGAASASMDAKGVDTVATADPIAAAMQPPSLVSTGPYDETPQVRNRSPYTDRIASMAPRHHPGAIEGLMRVEHGTLDHLSKREFHAEVELCAGELEDIPPYEQELIASDFGFETMR